MMAKQLSFDHEAREHLQAGVEKLARAVRSTFGPRGRTAVIDKGWGNPTVTKDGVTVAEEVELSDPYENLGAQLVKEAASKTSDVAGDGTTTATVLAEAIYGQSLRFVTAGANVAAIGRGIQKAVDKVVEFFEGFSRKIDSKEEIAQVATVAANADVEIGEMIAEAMEKVGRDGVITVEEGKGIETSVDVVEGMQFDRGFQSPHFVTDADRMECVMEDAHVLIYEDKISAATKLVPLLETISKGQRPLLIISESVDGDALATLVVNKMRGILKVCAVKAPGYGDRRKAMLEDIATLTAARPIFKDLGVDLESVQPSDLGTAKRLIIDSDNTTIIEGAGSTADISARCAQIRREIENTDSDYDREKLQERLARLSGGVAQINVGAATESHMKERKARVEDALHATRAAVEEGVLPGGGVALIRAEAVLEGVELESDEQIGLNILRKVLAVPAQCIAENAGYDGALTAMKIRAAEGTHGFDVTTGETGDMYAKGIVDPTKVTRSALQNAASVASLLISTEALVTDLPAEDGDEEDHHHHGMDDF
ncbi:MAG: chaperonin GroEL [Planctomycetota bacterium]|nr:chaperonin GroEL [Planctomycetota bacterium]